MNYIDPPASRPRPALLPAVALGDIAEIAWRFRRGALLIVLATIVCCAGYSYLLRGDAFMAEAKLLVRLGQEQAPAPTMIADRSLLFGNQVAITSSEIELLRSRDLIAKLVDRIDFSEHPRPPASSWFGALKDQARTLWRSLHDGFDDMLIAAGLKLQLAPRAQAMEAISQSLLVDTPPGGNVVTIRLIWPERGTAEGILQQLLSLYFEQRANLFQGSTASRFFTDRLAEAATHLKAAETALAEFERSHQITNPDEQRNGLLKRLNEAEIGVDAAVLETETAETSQRQQQAAGGTGPGLGFAQNGSPLQQSLSGELATAMARLAASETMAGPQDPAVQHQTTEVAARARLLRQQTAATASQRRGLLVRRIAQRDTIRVELATLQAAIGPWQDLKREVASALRAYEFNDGKLNEAAGIAALEAARIGNVSIVEHPVEQALPVGVRKSSLLMLATLAGLLVALTYVVLRAFFDHRLHRATDLEQRLGLRALAAIPDDRRGFAASGRQAAATDQAIARAAAGLARGLTGTSFQALAVIGAARGEGATTVTLHLGRHLAGRLGMRVLLADMSPATSPRSPDLMTRAAALPQPPHVLDCGRLGGVGTLPAWAIIDLRGGGAAALAQLRQVIQAARNGYDFLLIDTPPYQDSIDTLLASRHCGQTLLVARADNLSWQVFRQLQGDLADEGVVMAGAVLNRTHKPLPRLLTESLR